MANGIHKDLGKVTAYSYAKAAGYTGTEEQFQAIFNEFTENAPGLIDRMDTAVARAEAAVTNIDATVQDAVDDAVEEATASAVATANQAVSDAQAAQASAEGAVTQANAAVTQANSAVSAAQAAQAAAEDAAESFVLDRTLTDSGAAAPADLVGDLKESIDQLTVVTVFSDVELANGSVANHSNGYAVYTDTLIPVADCIKAKIIVKKPLSNPDYFYCFGYQAYSADGSAFGSYVDFKWTDGYMQELDIYAGVAYIRWTIAEGKSSSSKATLRTTSFADGDVVVELTQSGNVLDKIDTIETTIYKNINTSEFDWEIGGLGSNGENYARNTSIRTSGYYLISKLNRILLSDDFNTGYICLYADSGPHNGFLVRLPITKDSQITQTKLLGYQDTATRFRLEIGNVDGDVTKYNLVSIISSEENSGSLRIYDKELQELKMMLLHKTGSETYGRCDFSAMIMSDIHGEMQRTKKIIDIMASWGTDYFDAFINCGDTVVTTYATDLTTYYNMIGTLGIPHINVVGNHDAWSSLGTLGDQATAYGKIISPLIGQAGLVQPDNATEDSLCYYYFDIGNIRIIALDCMFWDNNEDTWLASVLGDALTNNKAVICVSHYGLGSSNMTQLKSLWREVDVPTNSAINISAAEKVNNFMSAGGEFICWLVGHTHGDNLHKAENYGNQLVLTFASPVQRAGYLQKSDVSTDYNYTVGTFLTVDRYFKTVRLLRIGADIDTWGIKHNGVSLNYQTGELIAAW